MKAIIDFHVHIYPEYDTTRVFSSFHHHSNIRFPANESQLGILCLTEREGETLFRESIKNPEESLFSSVGTVHVSDDKLALHIANNDRKFIVICGRQIVSKERLEVLFIGRDLSLPDKTYSVVELIKKGKEAGAIPVLPWSLGKWLFSRGKIVESTIKNKQPICLGATSLRPTLFPKSKIEKEAEKNFIPILPGSDPLPIGNEEDQIGRFTAQIEINGINPTSELVDFIQNLGEKNTLDYPKCKVSLFKTIQRSISLRLRKYK